MRIESEVSFEYVIPMLMVPVSVNFVAFYDGDEQGIRNKRCHEESERWASEPRGS